MKYNWYINKIASTTFGVLLIHANSDSMRQLLWKDLLKNEEMYYSNFIIAHAFISVIIIFVVGSVLDIVRQMTLERWFLSLYDIAEIKITKSLGSLRNRGENK